MSVKNPLSTCLRLRKVACTTKTIAGTAFTWSVVFTVDSGCVIY